jgi:hypothetical protein
MGTPLSPTRTAEDGAALQPWLSASPAATRHAGVSTNAANGTPRQCHHTMPTHETQQLLIFFGFFLHFYLQPSRH